MSRKNRSQSLCMKLLLSIASLSFMMGCGENSTGPTNITPISTLPASPTLSSPYNGATGIDTSILLSWSHSSGSGSYHLQPSTLGSFAANATIDKDGLSDTLSSASGLAENTTYYWRVNASNSNGSSDWSNTWNFTTSWKNFPVTPMLSLPINGSTGISLNPVLSWLSSSRAASYRIQVSKSSSFATTTVDQSGLTIPSRNVNGLVSKTTYYWRTNALNGKGPSGWSDTWSFTTSLCQSSSKYGFSICLPSEWELVSDKDNVTSDGSLYGSPFLGFILADTNGATIEIAGLVITAFWPINAPLPQSSLDKLVRQFVEDDVKFGTSVTTSQVVIDGNIGCEASYLDTSSISLQCIVTLVQYGSILFELYSFTPKDNFSIGKQGLRDIIATAEFRSATVAKSLAKSPIAPVSLDEFNAVVNLGRKSLTCLQIQNKIAAIGIGNKNLR